MAKECCLCGKKISMIDYAFSLSESSYKICTDCNDHIKKFKMDNASEEELKIAEMYCTKLIETRNVEYGVKMAITTMISKNKKDVQQKKDEFQEYKKQKEAYEQLQDNKMITTGYGFEGYRIVSHHGVVSGEMVLGTGFLSELDADFSDLFGTEVGVYSKKIKTARKAAEQEMMREAIKAGANAIIGVDLDYSMFSRNIIGVFVSGTAVKIEKTIE